jgi:hypothetical protein
VCGDDRGGSGKVGDGLCFKRVELLGGAVSDVFHVPTEQYSNLSEIELGEVRSIQ